MRVDSNLLQDMQRYAFSPGPGGLPLRVYGDAAYLLRVQFQAPFTNMIFTPRIVNFSKTTISPRVFEEYLFGEYFTFVDSKKKPQDFLPEESCKSFAT